MQSSAWIAAVRRSIAILRGLPSTDRDRVDDLPGEISRPPSRSCLFEKTAQRVRHAIIAIGLASFLFLLLRLL